MSKLLITEIEPHIRYLSAVELIHALMQNSWPVSYETMQDYMNVVAERFEGRVRISSPSEFADDLVQIGLVKQKGPDCYLFEV